MNMKPVFFLALALSAAPAFAEPTPQTASADTRIKSFVYDEADVYTIRTKYGYQTNIVFAPQEDIQTISVGDRSLWQIIPAGNRLFIRPMTEDITTNMTVLTNRRSYEFDLKSVAPGSENNIYVARFSYPDKTPKTRPQAEAPSLKLPETPPQTIKLPAPSAAVNPPPADPRPLQPNYNYTYAGPDAAAPQQVYDDGRTTFIKYNAIPQQIPTISVIGANGKEYNAAYRVQGNVIAVDGVSAEMSLRSPNGTILIYNELLDPR